MKARDLGQVNKDGPSHQRLYKLDPPLEGHEYVIVSATIVFTSGPETYIFASNEKGEITNWCELEGSQRGTLNPVKVLQNAGYEVA